jgi:hypothetical protein
MEKLTDLFESLTYAGRNVTMFDLSHPAAVTQQTQQKTSPCEECAELRAQLAAIKNKETQFLAALKNLQDILPKSP